MNFLFSGLDKEAWYRGQLTQPCQKAQTLFYLQEGARDLLYDNL